MEHYGKNFGKGFLGNARQDIKESLEKGVAMGPSINYSDNVITYTLIEVANQLGTQAANDLIEEFDLERLGWDKVNPIEFEAELLPPFKKEKND